jgi:hypothetical protein
MNMKPIVLLPEQLDRVSVCAQRLGLPQQQCIDEAIEDWLSIVAPARLAYVSQIEKPSNLIPFA